VAAETRANARGAQTAGDTALEFAARLGARPLATPTAQVQIQHDQHHVHTVQARSYTKRKHVNTGEINLMDGLESHTKVAI